MHIAIKNPAVAGPALEKMGDYHFGASLQKALEALGVRVTQHYWPDWDGDADADAVLVLRGRYRYRPRPGQLNVLWAISHPSAISVEEIDGYDLVYLASETHRKMIAGAGRPPLEVLRQCSDFAGTGPGAGRPAAERRGVIFVGNSRGVFRDIVQWSLAAGVRPALYGRGWEPIGLEGLVVSQYAENDRLPEIYGGARLGLNDHWNDMKYFGYINNRLFDCLFCGLPVISDTFPELRDTLGDGILHASDGASFRDSVRRAEADYDGLFARTRDLGERLRGDYTFAARARRILDDIGHLPGTSRRAGSETLPEAEGTLAQTRFPVFANVRQAVAGTGPARKQVLHIHPSREGLAALEADDVVVLTAGRGPGPWEVGLDRSASEIAHRRFDAVVVESLDGLAPSAGVDPRMLGALRRLTRRGGYFVVPAGAAGRSRRRELAGLGDADYRVIRAGRSFLPRSRLLRRLWLGLRLRAAAR